MGIVKIYFFLLKARDRKVCRLEFCSKLNELSGTQNHIFDMKYCFPYSSTQNKQLNNFLYTSTLPYSFT